MKNIGEVHQAFLPKGFLGAVNDNPYKLDVAKAKELLAKAGLPDGFTVTMDVRNDAADHRHRRGGPADAGAGRHQRRDHSRRRQADADQVPRPPARHLYRRLGPGLSGPAHQRADLRLQPGQRRRGASKTLAWRNAWDIPELAEQIDAAILEQDTAKRAALYEAMQKTVMETSPFVTMFQQTEVAALRAQREGLRARAVLRQQPRDGDQQGVSLAATQSERDRRRRARPRSPPLRLGGRALRPDDRDHASSACSRSPSSSAASCRSILCWPSSATARRSSVYRPRPRGARPRPAALAAVLDLSAPRC